MDYAGHLA